MLLSKMAEYQFRQPKTIEDEETTTTTRLPSGGQPHGSPRFSCQPSVKLHVAPWYQQHQCPSSMCRGWYSVLLFHGACVLVPVVQISSYLVEDDDDSDPQEAGHCNSKVDPIQMGGLCF